MRPIRAGKGFVLSVATKSNAYRKAGAMFARGGEGVYSCHMAQGGEGGKKEERGVFFHQVEAWLSD